MQQVLFHIPFTAGLFGNPAGIPVYGFGMMLFLTFVLAAMVWGPRRVAKVGLPRDRLQDLAILLFLFGIAGARIVYMIQYADQFRGQNLFLAFFQIWNGGIVFYGSVFGGIVGYILFRRFVLRKFGVSDWKLADALAPLIAFGLAVGRIGCYLNGCCWGQPVCEECQPVPLHFVELGQFPLLPAHARDQVVRAAGADDRLPQIRGLQTSTGFSLAPREDRPGSGDPRSVVAAVEPGSAAARAGLQPGDRIVRVNGEENRIVVEISGAPEKVSRAVDLLKSGGGKEILRADSTDGPQASRVAFDSPTAYQAAAQKAELLTTGAYLVAHDSLWELVRDWPRGQGELALEVERGGQSLPVAFTPRTVTFFPTQLYETVSMSLLVLLLLAYQPFRRHDGQVMVLLMMGYAVHRFLNEAIRIEPTYQLGLTLSQWISIAIFLAAVGLEVYLRSTQPRLPSGELPLSHGVAAPAVNPA
jgi:prolipoprotein diacylglyceryltransferase